MKLKDGDMCFHLCRLWWKGLGELGIKECSWADEKKKSIRRKAGLMLSLLLPFLCYFKFAKNYINFLQVVSGVVFCLWWQSVNYLLVFIPICKIFYHIFSPCSAEKSKWKTRWVGAWLLAKVSPPQLWNNVSIANLCKIHRTDWNKNIKSILIKLCL